MTMKQNWISKTISFSNKLNMYITVKLQRQYDFNALRERRDYMESILKIRVVTISFPLAVELLAKF